MLAVVVVAVIIAIRTEQRNLWRPARPGLIADLDAGHYFSG